MYSESTNGKDAEAQLLKSAEVLEQGVVQQLREEHTSRRFACVPAWLFPGGPREVVENIPSQAAMRIHDTYKKLRSGLHCFLKTDRVPAL